MTDLYTSQTGVSVFTHNFISPAQPQWVLGKKCIYCFIANTKISKDYNADAETRNFGLSKKQQQQSTGLLFTAAYIFFMFVQHIISFSNSCDVLPPPAVFLQWPWARRWEEGNRRPCVHRSTAQRSPSLWPSPSKWTRTAPSSWRRLSNRTFTAA